MQKNIIIGQSGGPTAVINSSLAGAITRAFEYDKIGTVYGMVNGIDGFMNEKLLNLTSIFKDMPYVLNRLKHTPAMFLGSCRYKLSGSDEEMKKIFSLLEKHNIGYFLYIGGNDSMDTVMQLSDYAKKINSDIKFVGVPKTIDNDLVGIDHSPGYGSAAKYIASCVREVAYDTTIYNTAYCVSISVRRISFLSKRSSALKSFTEAFTLSSSLCPGNHCSSVKPCFPSRRLFQKSSLVFPIGLTTPTPVITTLLIFIFPFVDIRLTSISRRLSLLPVR